MIKTMSRFFLSVTLMVACRVNAMDVQAPVRALVSSTNPATTTAYLNEQTIRLLPKIAIVTFAFQILKDHDTFFKGDLTPQNIGALCFKIGVLACVASMLELCFDGIPYFVKKIPSGFVYGTERFITGIYRVCGLPTPIGEERLIHQSIMFEDVINTLTKQQTSNSVMLRNVRVTQEETTMSEQEQEWAFYVSFVIHRLNHTARYMQDSIRYYRYAEEPKSWWQRFLERFSPDSIPDIVCTIEEIIANINHTVELLKATHTQDDLDMNYLKMLSTNTKTLFKELKILVSGVRKQESPSSTFNS